MNSAFFALDKRLCRKLSSSCGLPDIEKLSDGCKAWHARTVEAINFKSNQGVILHAVFLYVRYAVSYRDLEEILVF